VKAANSYLIGTDPEFVILDGANIRNVEGILPFQGKLGYDHGGRVVEIRPYPKQLASQLCADIFRQLNRRELVPLRRFRWKAGAMGEDQPIGGHIHFDIPFDGVSSPVAARPERSALDRLAIWFETLELFPHGEMQRRLDIGYGRRGDIRQAGRRPDGHARLEYRTPPSWLYSPKLSHLSLAAFKLAVVDPQHTLDTLQTPDVRPVTKFRDFFRGFAERDDDAAEIAPQLEKRDGLEAFRGDPTVDVKTAWDIPTSPTDAKLFQT
jgi:phiEco32-like amidoligase-type 2 protein